MIPPLALALLLAAPAPERFQLVEGTGHAAGDPAAARGQARDAALVACVRAAAAPLLTAAGEPDQERLLAERLDAQAARYVRRLELLEDREEGDGWVTRLRCEVAEGAVADALLAAGVAHRRAGLPRVLLLVAERELDEAQARGAWQGGDGRPRPLAAALADRLARSGFGVVGAGALDGRGDLAALGADPDLARARAAGRAAGAELVVLGRGLAIASRERPAGEGALHAARAAITARAVRVEGGAVVASMELTTADASGLDRREAGRAALAEGGRQLARELLVRVGGAWVAEGAAHRRIALVVHGVDDYGRLAAFKEAVARQVRGVSQVQDRSLEDGRAELELVASASVEELATELVTRRLGDFTVRLRSRAADRIELELRAR